MRPLGPFASALLLCPGPAGCVGFPCADTCVRDACALPRVACFTSIWQARESAFSEFFSRTRRGRPSNELLAPPARVSRMWGVERDTRASLGRRGARGDGLVVVSWASLVVAAESGLGVAASHRVGHLRWGGRVRHVSV